MKTNTEVMAILAALCAATSVLSAETPSTQAPSDEQVQLALRSVNVFARSLKEWGHRPTCAPGDKECLRQWGELLDHMALDAQDFLNKSTVLFRYNGKATDEKLAPSRAVWAGCVKIARLAIRYKNATLALLQSRTVDEAAERRPEALAAYNELNKAILDFAKEGSQ